MLTRTQNATKECASVRKALSKRTEHAVRLFAERKYSSIDHKNHINIYFRHICALNYTFSL